MTVGNNSLIKVYPFGTTFKNTEFLTSLSFLCCHFKAVAFLFPLLFYLFFCKSDPQKIKMGSKPSDVL